MKLLYANILILFFCACQSTPTAIDYKPIGVIAGEWRYVNQFVQDKEGVCLICPDFDFEKAENKLVLNQDQSINCRLGALIIEGNYSSKELSNNFNPQIYRDLFLAKGDFKINTFTVLNKPYQTEAQTKLINTIQNSTSYYLYTNIQTSLLPYDQLKLYFTANDYLFFVRKK